MQSLKAIGLMSGTSVDGLDMALCKFENHNEKWNVEILKTQSVAYEKSLQKSLLSAAKLSGEELTLLDSEFAIFTANSVKAFIDNNNFVVDIIASHGHTVFHKPESAYTKQIGNGEIISKICGIPVVSDFRSGDVSLGGQGAPLVPIGDMLLFSEYDACLNLGGFSNISFKSKIGDRIAFDISPVNIVLNEFARKLGLDFDDKGNIAKNGKLIESLFDELNDIEFYKLHYPKSLSREWVEKNIYPIIGKYRDYKTVDLLRTFTQHFAFIVSRELKNHKRVLVTGGGAYNDYFVDLLRDYCESDIVIPRNELVEFKEALIFAFLGTLRWFGCENVLSSVTGASRNSCSGVISMP